MISFKGVCLQNTCKCHTISKISSTKRRGHEQTAILISQVGLMFSHLGPIFKHFGPMVGSLDRFKKEPYLNQDLRTAIKDSPILAMYSCKRLFKPFEKVVGPYITRS